MSAAPPIPADIAKLSFEDALAELEQIVGRLEAGRSKLDDAIAAYERESAEFSPYTSKYDAYLRGQVKLSDAEMRGLALFNSSSKGNCAACHPSARGSDGSFPLFTDFSYDNLGVPRNWAIVDNADPSSFDLGLCQSAALDGVAVEALLFN